jgi:hypothetical protein
MAISLAIAVTICFNKRQLEGPEPELSLSVQEFYIIGGKTD